MTFYQVTSWIYFMRSKSLLALLLLVVPLGQAAQASCRIDRFNDLGVLSDIREEFSDFSLEYKLQQQAVQQKRDYERVERNTPPVELDLTLSASDSSGDLSSSSEARLSYDINFPLQFMNRKRSLLLDENYGKRLENIELEERLNFLRKALSWKYSQLQSRLYKSRLDILLERESYLTEKDRQGASVTSDLSKIKLELISLKNKILAVESRAEILLLDFQNVNLEILSNARLSWLSGDRPHTCETRSYEMVLAQDNIKYYTLQKKIDYVGNSLASNLFATQSLDDVTQDPTVGLTLRLTLISPKTRGVAVRGTQEELDQAHRDLHLAAVRLDKLYKEQNKVEELIGANLLAIEQEISDRERILEELSVRAALGQTIFDQKSSVMIELSNLEEVRAQRIFDLYTGWLQFMTVRGLED